MVCDTQAVRDDHWEIKAVPQGLDVVTIGTGLPVCHVLCPVSSIAEQVALHVIELHDRNHQGSGCAAEHVYAPASWYASEPWGWGQVLRRPWAILIDASGAVSVFVDSQFSEDLLSVPDRAVAEYLVHLHNFSLLPIR